MATVKHVGGVKARDADGAPFEPRAKELEALLKKDPAAMLAESAKLKDEVEARLKAKAKRSIESIKAAMAETKRQADSGVAKPSLEALKKQQQQGD